MQILRIEDPNTHEALDLKEITSKTRSQTSSTAASKDTSLEPQEKAKVVESEKQDVSALPEKVAEVEEVGLEQEQGTEKDTKQEITTVDQESDNKDPDKPGDKEVRQINKN